MIAENDKLKHVNEKLKEENKNLKESQQRMIANGFKADTDMGKLLEENQKLKSDNRSLKELLDAGNSLMKAPPDDTLRKFTPS